ncbi:hypothetical protein BDV40DRAFT_258068 [Aspergillus tamarii]|uniref:Uncharacterized protein n=1 Tax=Aspergillus tamarii TaxID=41984 RepID=A0A5N6V3X8_ASPTM|nr:hypothetical protein BDV40DRAFT_258068 [Aspergillus tamarii]
MMNIISQELCAEQYNSSLESCQRPADVRAHGARMPDVTTDEYRKGWLPISLRRTYLLSFSVMLLLMLVAIAFLHQYSIRQNGVVKYQRKEDLSSGAWRAYTDTPTIFAVLAMALWDTCAQNVLRLETYFQLARPDGVPANVLFMNYAFDNVILAPIRAARNRHWIVFCVSLMSLLMRILVPSLLSGLFVLTGVTLVETKTLDTWPSLVNLDIQESWFSSQATYSKTQNAVISDRSELYHPSKYATAPLSIPVDDRNQSSFLTLSQSVYWSNMTCVHVDLAGTIPSPVQYPSSTTDLMDHRRLSWNLRNVTIPEVGETSYCHVSAQLDSLVPYIEGRFQARHWEPTKFGANSSSFSVFDVDHCPSVTLLGLIIDLENTTEMFLHSNVTLFGCQPVYQKAIANVSLAWNSSITNAEITPSTVQDLGREEFSMHGLQRLIYSRRTVLGDQQMLIGPASEQTPTDSSRAMGRVRVAVIAGSDVLRLAQYQERIGRLWNDQFTTAISRFFDPVAGVFQTDAVQVTATVALTVVSQAAVILEIILFLGFVLLVFLSYYYPRRANVLHGNPSSLASQCASLARLISPQTLLALSHPRYHLAKTRDLRKWARGFWCLWSDRSSPPQIEITSRDGCQLGTCSPPVPSGRRDPMPHFLTIPWFLMECILLIGTVAAFGVAYRYMQFQNMGSFSSTEVQISSIFLIYGPTMISSVIRSLFTSIHRHLSVAEPWIRLRNGKVSAARLFSSTYGTLTPLLAFLRSGSRVPLSILALSIVCLLNLVLIVVSGGLFEPQLNKYYSSTAKLTKSYDPSRFSREGLDMDFTGYDSVLFTLMNQSFATWTTMDYSFLPLATNEPDGVIGVLYDAFTRGIGTYLNCGTIPRNHASTSHGSRMINWTYSPFDGPEVAHCAVQLRLDFDDDHIDQGAIRYVWPSDDNPTCQRSTFLVFASLANNPSAPPDQENFTALHCEPKIDIRDFHVHFDPQGVVQRYESVADSAITSGEFFNNASATLEVFNQGLGSFVKNLHSHAHLAFYQSSFPEHTTAQAYLSMKRKSTAVDPDTLIQAVQSVYQATFANYLTLRRDLFFNRVTPDTAVSVNGTTTYTIWGFMPSNTSIVIIISLVSIDVLALMAIFLLYHGRYDGPRIPKSLGSLIPWVAQSRMLQELGKTYDMDEKEREAFQQQDRQYRFWTYTRLDGERMWVLDYDERVGTELALRNPSQTDNETHNPN